MQISGMAVVVTMDMLCRVMKIIVMLLLDKTPICMAVIQAMQITNLHNNNNK